MLFYYTFLILCSLIFTKSFYANEVLYIKSSLNKETAKFNINLLTSQYRLRVVDINIKNEKSTISAKMKKYKSVIMDWDIFNKYILSNLHQSAKEKPKIMITGIDSTFRIDISSGNSSYNSSIIQHRQSESKQGFFRFLNNNPIANVLSNVEFPIITERIEYFHIGENFKSDIILEFQDIDAKRYPVFIRTNYHGYELFISAVNICTEDIKDILKNKSKFYKIAPIMMFARYTLGKKCLGPNASYANLTIDDPWLVEPYGELEYYKLVTQMKKNNFHTTIAFVPWNFDRSKSDVVSLFKANEKYLSLCIHGNNHDHQEFGLYNHRPISQQEIDIVQGLARMEKFKENTNLNYDRIMVFPHQIAPSNTLKLLKKYNFYGTFNSNNIPLDHNKKSSFARLRSVTLDYENFPSIIRYVPNRPKYEIAVDLFLGNPLIFYTHHQFFAEGIDKFNNIAEFVNKIDSSIKWTSLGEIMENLYLIKQHNDYSYDIIPFSHNFIIENKSTREIGYNIIKYETFNIPIINIYMDENPIDYKVSDKSINFQIYLDPMQKSRIKIIYKNEFDIQDVEISKNSLRVKILRYISDFRDLTLSKYYLGEVLTKAYYDNVYFGMFLIILVVLSIILSMLFVIFIFKMAIRKLIKPGEI